MSSFHAWRLHFESNRERPLPRIEAPSLPAPQHAALVRSLKRFQLGESGEGRIAHEIDTYEAVDDDYRAALKLFVAEEGRHARILGLMVKALGGTLLQRSWTERLFVHARRLFGVRFKLLVLLAAEVVGIAFYGMLSRVLPRGPMADALAQICRDEESHLKFHRDFFTSQHWVLWAAWWPLGSLATLAVLWDHRRTLRAFDIPFAVAARRFAELVRESSWPLLRARRRESNSPVRTSAES